MLKSILIFLFICYIFYLLYLTLLSHYYGRTYTHSSVNLIPFKTIYNFAFSGFKRNTIITNLLGNIVAFMPMGIGLYGIFGKMRKFKVFVIICLLASLIIEITQYSLSVGAFDIDDLILNVIGGCIGFYIMKFLFFLFDKSHK